MKTALYEMVPNVADGTWIVKLISRQGMIAQFKSKAEAERFLRGISGSEPKESPVVIDTTTGKVIDSECDSNSE